MQNFLPKLLEKGIKFEWVGNPDILPIQTVELLENTRETAKNGTKMTFILAIGYGGQDEIVRALKKFMKEG
ncbi:hypothetical protein GW830_03915 [bacterium]|nr:hypothetical protein [bacterium]